MSDDEAVLIDGHRCLCTVAEHDINGSGVLYQAVIELPDKRLIAGPHRPDREAARSSAWWSAHRVWHATCHCPSCRQAMANYLREHRRQRSPSVCNGSTEVPQVAAKRDEGAGK